MTETFNRLSSMVVESILFCEENSRRQILVFMIKLAKQFFKVFLFFFFFSSFFSSNFDFLFFQKDKQFRRVGGSYQWPQSKFHSPPQTTLDDSQLESKTFFSFLFSLFSFLFSPPFHHFYFGFFLQYKKSFDEFDEMLDPDLNFKGYRNMLQTVEPPILPWMGPKVFFFIIIFISFLFVFTSFDFFFISFLLLSFVVFCLIFGEFLYVIFCFLVERIEICL